MGRAALPEDMVEAAIYFASSADFTTGQVLLLMVAVLPAKRWGEDDYS